MDSDPPAARWGDLYVENGAQIVVCGKNAKRIGRPIRDARFCLAAAAVVIAATAAAVGLSDAVAVAAAAEQQNQHDDPPAVAATETVITTHNLYLQEISLRPGPYIPCYSDGKKRCGGGLTFSNAGISNLFTNSSMLFLNNVL